MMAMGMHMCLSKYYGCLISNHTIPIFRGATLVHSGTFCWQQVRYCAASQGCLPARTAEPVLSCQREPDDIPVYRSLKFCSLSPVFMPCSLHL